jgi:Fe-S cluster assembly protein SufD
MAIESFLKVDKEDPDWCYSPAQYYGKQFKVIDANCLLIKENTEDVMVLRLAPTEPELLCKNLQIVGKESSKLDLFILCDGSDQTQQVFLYTVTAEPNSILNIGIFAKNGKLNKHIIECECHEGSTVNIFGLAENSVGGSSEIICKTFHAGDDVETNQLVNCVSGKDSRTVFQGYVKILDETVDSFTHIENKSIIADPTGQAFSIPQLLIDCGNVEASQSCDIGEIDPTQLWYLQTRGLSLEDAKKLLIAAHQDSVLNLVQYQDLKDELKDFFRD